MADNVDRSEYSVPMPSGLTQTRDHYAALGGVAVIVGALLAVFSIPEDPEPRGALFWPALWCSLGLLSIPMIRTWKETAVLLRSEHFLMIGLVYWLLLDPLQGAYPLTGVTYSEVVTAFSAIALMAIGIWVGVSGVGWSLPRSVLSSAKWSFKGKTLFWAAVMAFGLGMFNFAFTSGFDPITMINGLSACRFCAPWNRGAFGGADAIVEHLKYFGYILPALTVLVAHQDGWRRLRTISAATMSLVMIVFLSQDGGRRVIGVMIGAALITWVLLRPRIKPNVAAGALAAVLCLLVFMDLMLQFRAVGLSASGEQLSTQAEEVLVRVDDNILRLTQIIKFFPDTHSYVDLEPLVYALVRPIPRLFWPGKPVDPGYDLTALLGQEGFSLTHSVIGEFYAMHGLFVVLVGGFVFGRMANMWNKLLAIRGGDGKSMTYGLGVMALFAGLRSMQDLVIMSYGLLAWFVIIGILARVRSSSNRVG